MYDYVVREREREREREKKNWFDFTTVNIQTIFFEEWHWKWETNCKKIDRILNFEGLKTRLGVLNSEPKQFYLDVKNGLAYFYLSIKLMKIKGHQKRTGVIT